MKDSSLGLASKWLKKINPVVYIFLSFALVILVGSILLVLPISSSGPENRLSYINALFLATSAVCVTGLSPIADLSVALSVFGKITMGVLIQVGGLGLVTILSFIFFVSGRRMNLAQANILKEALNQKGLAELKKHIKRIILITFCFELLGFILNFIVFIQDYPFWNAVGISLFHAVSSFNNAGFDIIGSTSLEAYKDDVLLNVSTCILIICGGLGFLVYEDLFERKHWKRFSIQTKIVLITNFVLLVISVVSIKGVEGKDISWLQAIFYAVNLRTAGFATFSLKDTLSPAGGLLSIILMFIGGSPLSTAGGIKTTTLFVILSSIFSFSKGKNTVVFKREINSETKAKSFVLFTSGVLTVLTASLFVSLLEMGKNDFTLMQIVFEVTSAFGTVGYTMGVTTLLSTGSKIILCLVMYTGRLGLMTFLSLFGESNAKKESKNLVNYLGTDLMIG